MISMKRYAVHRVYISKTQYITQASLSINTKGEVENYAPFINETAETEWLGGIIILSNKIEINNITDFRTIINYLATAKHGIYAWHISNFDFQSENLTPKSQIKRLI